jgi:hypothetical protein
MVSSYIYFKITAFHARLIIYLVLTVFYIVECVVFISMIKKLIFNKQDAFVEAGQVTELREAVRWGADYMVKAHVGTDRFYCQVNQEHTGTNQFCY